MIVLKLSLQYSVNKTFIHKKFSQFLAKQWAQVLTAISIQISYNLLRLVNIFILIYTIPDNLILIFFPITEAEPQREKIDELIGQLKSSDRDSILRAAIKLSDFYFIPWLNKQNCKGPINTENMAMKSNIFVPNVRNT